jgi:hypothetical protein
MIKIMRMDTSNIVVMMPPKRPPVMIYHDSNVA